MRRIGHTMLVGLLVVLGGACGPPEERTRIVPDDQSAVTSTTEAGTQIPAVTVEANDVVILGNLSADQAREVRWALDRFRPGRSQAAGGRPIHVRPDAASL